MTATVETMSEQLDLATSVPLNKTLTAFPPMDKISKNSDGKKKSFSL